jgi:hypothetical protein
LTTSRPCFRRGLVTELLLGFVAVLEGQFDAIVVGRLEVDLGEDQVLLERLAGRAQAGLQRAAAAAALVTAPSGAMVTGRSKRLAS